MSFKHILTLLQDQPSIQTNEKVYLVNGKTKMSIDLSFKFFGNSGRCIVNTMLRRDSASRTDIVTFLEEVVTHVENITRAQHSKTDKLILFTRQKNQLFSEYNRFKQSLTNLSITYKRDTTIYDSLQSLIYRLDHPR